MGGPSRWLESMSCSCLFQFNFFLFASSTNMLRSKTAISRLFSTFSNQSKLPHLPIPTINESGAKYLETVLPLVKTEAELVSVRASVDSFMAPDGLAHKLQERLVEYAKGRSNWLEELWLGFLFLFNSKKNRPSISLVP